MSVALAALVAGSLLGVREKSVELFRTAPAAVDERRVYAGPRRPTALPWLYGTYVTFQALDVWSTTRAVAAGAEEANPLVAHFARNPLGLTAMKVATTTATIYFVERLWRTNRAGAIVLTSVLNGASALVVIHNTRVAHRARGRR